MLQPQQVGSFQVTAKELAGKVREMWTHTSTNHLVPVPAMTCLWATAVDSHGTAAVCSAV